MLCVGTIEHPLLGRPACLPPSSPHSTSDHQDPHTGSPGVGNTWQQRELEGLTEAYREREGGFDWQERVLFEGVSNWISRRSGGPGRGQKATVYLWHRLRESGEVTDACMHACTVTHLRSDIQAAPLSNPCEHTCPLNTIQGFNQRASQYIFGMTGNSQTWLYRLVDLCWSLSDANCEKSWSGFVVFPTLSWGEQSPWKPLLTRPVWTLLKSAAHPLSIPTDISVHFLLPLLALQQLLWEVLFHS